MVFTCWNRNWLESETVVGRLLFDRREYLLTLQLSRADQGVFGTRALAQAKIVVFVVPIYTNQFGVIAQQFGRQECVPISTRLAPGRPSASGLIPDDDVFQIDR